MNVFEFWQIIWKLNLPLNRQVRIPFSQATGKMAFHPHDRIDRYLGRAPLIIGALGFCWLLLHAELCHCLARCAEQTVRAIKDGLPGKTRDNGACIHAVAEAYQVAIAHEAAQGAQPLILATEVPKFAR